MKEKLTIKKHDGPGRLIKINNELSPKTINLKKYKIAKYNASSYNVEKEIAEYNVKKTIANAKKETKKEIAVIQGSKYIDLRCQCGTELEKLGYQYLIIANSDELILHPHNLIDLIITLRKTLKISTYLIFPFAEPTFIPLLAYIGIDFFNDETGDYYADLNILMTQTKNYDLNKNSIYDLSKEELKKYNKNTIDLVLREVRAHMENGSLRNLIEERGTSNPQISSALRILDKNYQDYLQKYTQLY